MKSMTKALFTACFVLTANSAAWATWSIVAVDKKTGHRCLGHLRRAGRLFPRRQPVPSRDLMDLQAVIVPGVGVAACQAGVDNTHKNQMTVFEELRKYYAYIRVTDEDIKPAENANPVKTLRMRYDAWKKAGSKPFSTVPTVKLQTTNQ